MSSRFFQTGGSSSSSSESESEPEEQVQQKTSARPNLMDSDSEEEVRVVKSKGQKYAEEVQEIANVIQSKAKVGDWGKVEEHYATLNKTADKYRFERLPGTYLKAITDLSSSIEEAWAGKKDLGKLMAKALTTLRSQFRKNLKEERSGKVLEVLLEEYRKNPSAFDVAVEAKPEAKKAKAVKKDESEDEEEESEDEEESEEESESEDEKKPTKGKGKEVAPTKSSPAKATKESKASKADADESDEEEWSNEEEEDSDESGKEDESVGYFGYTREYFLKKKPSEKDIAEKVARQMEREERRLKRLEEAKEEEARIEAEQLAGGDDGFSVVGKRQAKKEKTLFEKDEKVTHESVKVKFIEILDDRGKKGTAQEEQIRLLRELKAAAATANLDIGVSAKILMQIVASHFDGSKSISGYMKTSEWATCHNDYAELLHLLTASDKITIQPTIEDDKENVTDPLQPYTIRGDIVTFVERLDDEYTKSLQHIDPHTPDYVDRLRDEIVLYNCICQTERYFERLKSDSDISRVRLRRLEHIYYKREYVAVAKRRPGIVASEAAAGASVATTPEQAFDWVLDDKEEANISGLVERLCTFLYAQPGDRIRTRAILCHIFHLALFNKWHQARDLMLMSHLQESISHSDIPTQILYNRAMVQLGLCAFRAGHIVDAHFALLEIWGQNRAKELLAQGVQKFNEKSAEDIKIERRRQTPFHMHINIELLESAFYTSAMLIEIPMIAQQQHDPTRFRMTSKPFRKQLEYFCKQPFSGPPENTRDHIMSAALSMLKGDWKECTTLILNLKVWNLFPKSDDFKAMLRAKIQEEALRTYLFAFSGFFDSISLETLCETFELQERTVHCVVSKMIISEELQASHDQPSKTLVIHKAELTALQSLAVKFSEKVSNFVETNERLFDVRQNAYGFKDNKQQGGGGPSNRGRGRGRGGYRGRGGRGNSNRNYNNNSNYGAPVDHAF